MQGCAGLDWASLFCAVLFLVLRCCAEVWSVELCVAVRLADWRTEQVRSRSVLPGLSTARCTHADTHADTRWPPSPTPAGSDRSPIGGLGALKCVIQRDGPDSSKLPTSHTCFNTLLLPEYASRGKMENLLKLAILNSEGFGLE